MAYESLWPDNQTRDAGWCTTNSKKIMGGGLRAFGRRPPDRFSEWSGRLAGGRLGLGGGGYHAGAAAPLVGSASSIRVDDRLDGDHAGTSSSRAYSGQIDEHGHELHRMRTTIEQLSRKLDEVLAQKGP